MGITFYIRKRKTGYLYLQIRTDDTNNYIRIESKDEGVAIAKRHIEQYFADQIVSQDKPKKHGYKKRGQILNCELLLTQFNQP